MLFFKIWLFFLYYTWIFWRKYATSYVFLENCCFCAASYMKMSYCFWLLSTLFDKFNLFTKLLMCLLLFPENWSIRDRGTNFNFYHYIMHHYWLWTITHCCSYTVFWKLCPQKLSYHLNTRNFHPLK